MTNNKKDYIINKIISSDKYFNFILEQLEGQTQDLDTIEAARDNEDNLIYFIEIHYD